MFRAINWRRMFADLGWAMAMTEPMCYSYYLASRTSRDRVPDIGEPGVVFQRPRFGNRASLSALRPE
jgi:hypothetical protein